MAKKSVANTQHAYTRVTFYRRRIQANMLKTPPVFAKKIRLRLILFRRKPPKINHPIRLRQTPIDEFLEPFAGDLRAKAVFRYLIKNRPPPIKASDLHFLWWSMSEFVRVKTEIRLAEKHRYPHFILTLTASVHSRTLVNFYVQILGAFSPLAALWPRSNHQQQRSHPRVASVVLWWSLQEFVRVKTEIRLAEKHRYPHFILTLTASVHSRTLVNFYVQILGAFSPLAALWPRSNHQQQRSHPRVASVVLWWSLQDLNL